MRISHLLIILALLFLFSERSNASKFHSSPMEISDALPVQFWLTGCATYNEHYADGVHHRCFCAPWECDDEILIQFKDDPSQNFSLLVFDDDENLLDTLPIDEVAVGVYELAYVPSGDGSPEVCDDRIILKIRRDVGLQGILLPAFTSWANLGGAGNPWTISSTPNISMGANIDSEFLYVDYAFIPGVTYNVVIHYTSSAITFGAQIQVRITDNSDNELFSNGSDFIVTSGDRETTPVSFLATSSTTRIAIRIVGDAFAGISVWLNSTEAQRTVGDSEIVAKTDCLDIKQNQENTVLLSYSNVRDFAGLVFSGSSPDNTFQIRIPAIFFHQRFPEEDEVMELSSELVTLNATLRKQRLLDVDSVPYYFHEKVKLILKHQILTTLNRHWVKQEAYEILDGDRRWPLKKAKCWLSEKDFVHRNIL